MGVELINELQHYQRRMNTGIDLMRRYGKELAEAEEKYRIAKAQEILKLRDKGFPATIIQDLAKGATASLKFRVDVAQTMLDAAREDVMAAKMEIRVTEAQIEREWVRDS